MARKCIIGAETGDLSEIASTGAVAVVSSAFARSGAYSIKFPTSASPASALMTTGLGLATIYYKIGWLISSASAPSADTYFLLGGFYDSTTTKQCEVYLFQPSGGGTYTVYVFDSAGATAASASGLSLDASKWYTFEVRCTKGAGTGSVDVYIDSVLVASASSQQFGANNIDRVFVGYQIGGVQSFDAYYDDIEVDDAALCGPSNVIARQFRNATATYEDWDPSSGAIGFPNWNDTPFGTTNYLRSAVANAAQTGFVASVTNVQSGHGTEIIGAGDIIKGLKAALVGKTAFTTAAGISVVGTNQAGSAIDGGNVTLTFSTAPSPGDVILVFGGHFKGGASYGPTGVSGTQYLNVIDPAGSANNAGFGFWYKVMTGDDTDTAVTCLGSGTTTEATAYCSTVLRGVDTSVVLDQTTVQATGNSTNPNPGSITTVTNGALVVAAAGSVVNETSIIAVSGYGNFAEATGNDTGNDFSTAICSLVKASLGAEDPAAFTSWSTGNWRAITVAIRPGTDAGSAAKIRRRFNSSNTDTSITLTTSDAYYETSVFTDNLTNILTSEVGVVHGSTSALQTVEDAWLMISYLPTRNPTYDLLQEQAFVRPRNEMVGY